MEVFNVTNVNQAFPLEINAIKAKGMPRNSRNGPVLEFPEPVATTYRRPTERVLFDKNRMCNPFFHHMEGLWIIGGYRDVEFLDYFNSQMKQYSDDGVTFWGAYGHRLRHALGFDQLEKAITLLKLNPEDRRVVTTMWSPDLDLGQSKLDHPCNTHIYWKVRDGKLLMTVCCRSNDMLYGKLGANVVHFSMLQEYVAGRTEYEIGPYTQVSDSLHVYTKLPVWKNVENTSYVPTDYYDSEYAELLVQPYPMFKDCTVRDWEHDLQEFMVDPQDDKQYRTLYFQDVVQPISLIWWEHKRTRNGLKYIDSIKASDWRTACKIWLKEKEA
jgi:thymidylate synthase